LRSRSSRRRPFTGASTTAVATAVADAAAAAVAFPLVFSGATGAAAAAGPASWGARERVGTIRNSATTLCTINHAQPAPARPVALMSSGMRTMTGTVEAVVTTTIATSRCCTRAALTYVNGTSAGIVDSARSRISVVAFSA
jgi:hypothetical protein